MSTGKDILDFVQQVELASTVEEIEKLFLAYARPFGVEYFMCAQMYVRGHVFKPQALFGATGHEWYQYYHQFKLFFEDAVAVRCSLVDRPISWSEVEAEGGLTKGQAHVLGEPRNFGLTDGLAIPLHGPDGALAGVSVSGSHFKSDAVIAAAMEMMAQAAYRKYTEITGGRALMVDIPKLSRRQRECLMWVQHGKSNDDIAQLLKISPNTVKVHVEAAKRVLGVSTRLEAVVVSRRFNLLGF